MLVWADGQSGTIGGGALEFDAAERARSMATDSTLTQVPLGPALGQCCGGAVTLLSERFSAAPTGDIFARPTGNTPMPLSVKRLLAQARNGATPPRPQMVDGWMIEPIAPAAAPLWIYGAGHVGRALVATIAPLPDFAITWVDTAPDRFPDQIAENIRALPTPDPAAAVALAPADARHLILTYSHALDLELCHRLLGHGFASAGLIGSATKWARFRSRLSALGHTNAQISRICCPIGRPELGKHPQAIALGVASELILSVRSKETANKQTGDATG